MATTIQISPELQQELSKRKIFDRETYEEIIWNIIEDTLELSAEAKREIQEAREDVKKGKVFTIKQVRKDLGL